MTALTPDDLARIEELAEKATPGPWDADAVRPFAEIAPDDARFVSAARTAVPALVAGVRSLQARIMELEAVIESALTASLADVPSLALRLGRAQEILVAKGGDGLDG